MRTPGAGDPYLAAQLADCARRAVQTARPVFSRFLDPAQGRLALDAARSQGAQARLWGGYEDAERRIAAFFAGDEPDPTPEPSFQWPLRWLRYRWDARYGAPRHRDLLGALLGQGIGRDALGDLLLLEGQAYCSALTGIAGCLAGSLREAGRVPLRFDLPGGAPPLSEPRTAMKRETVASLRLDAILAAGWDLSRHEASALIAQGRVRVDHLPQDRPDARLAQGALVSVRGKGRFRLTEIGAANKKGRIGIVLLHYQ